MLVAIKITTSQLQVKPIENFILPYKLGQSRLIQGYHDFIYKIEANQLHQYVQILKEQATLLNVTYYAKIAPRSKIMYENKWAHVRFTLKPTNQSDDESIISLLKQTINNIDRTESKFENIFPGLQRRKRSPFDIVGYVGNKLFGIMDSN